MIICGVVQRLQSCCARQSQRASSIEEDHRKPIFCITFNSLDPNPRDVFASVGGHRVSSEYRSTHTQSCDVCGETYVCPPFVYRPCIDRPDLLSSACVAAQLLPHSFILRPRLHAAICIDSDALQNKISPEWKWHTNASSDL